MFLLLVSCDESPGEQCRYMMSRSANDDNIEKKKKEERRRVVVVVNVMI